MNKQENTHSNLFPSFSCTVGVLDKGVAAPVTPLAFFPVRTPNALQENTPHSYSWKRQAKIYSWADILVSLELLKKEAKINTFAILHEPYRYTAKKENHNSTWSTHIQNGSKKSNFPFS